MKINYTDKDKSIIDGIHNKFRDLDANEIKNVVNTNAPTNIAFSFSIPFNLGIAIMSAYTVTAPSIFTINSSGATAGMGTLLRIIADGSNTPDFSVFKKVGAGGYSNIIGIINQIIFYFDGYDYCASFNQISTIVAPSPTPTPTPSPTIGVSPTPTPTITASITVTPTSTVTPTVTPTIGVSVTPTVTPTVTSTITPTLTPTNTVTPTVTASVTPTITPSITPSTSAPSAVFLIPVGAAGQTESPTHTYTFSGVTTMTFDKSLAANADGSMTFDVPDSASESVPLGWDTNNTQISRTEPWFLVVYREQGTNKLVIGENGSYHFDVVTDPVTSSHQVKVTRTSGTIKVWYSTDGGTNFSLIRTLLTNTQVQIFAKGETVAGLGNKLVNVRGIGFA